MRYAVTFPDGNETVDVRETSGGVEVSLDEGKTWRPARLTPSPAPLHVLELGDLRHDLRLEADPLEPQGLLVSLDSEFPVRVRAQDARSLTAQRGRAAGRAQGPSLERSAMPGVIVEVRVTPNQEVERGDVLLVLEAMKMQNEIRAQRAGTIKTVHVKAGDSVPGGAKLVEFAAPPTESSPQ